MGDLSAPGAPDKEFIVKHRSTFRFLVVAGVFVVGFFSIHPSADARRGRKRGGGGDSGGSGPLKVVKKLTGHGNSVTSLSFAKDGTTLASGSLDSSVRMWDTSKGSQIRTIQLEEGTIIYRVVWNPNRPQLAVASTAGVTVYNDSGKEQFKLKFGSNKPEDAAYGPDGESLAAVFPEGVATWTTDEGVKVKENTKIKGGKSVAFRPEAPGLVAVGGRNFVTLWFPSDGETKNIKVEGEILSLAFSPDGRKLASFGSDRRVRCYDVDAAKEIWMKEDVANDVKVTWSADGKVVLSGGGDGDMIKAFGADDGADSWEYKPPTPAARVVAASKNGKIMASAGEAEILILTAR